MAHVTHAPPITTTAGEILPVARAPFLERVSWAMYDFANTVWSMNVATLFFAVWLVEVLGASSLAMSIGTAISSLLILVSIPIFGAISDARQRRKPWVVGFTIISCVATALIGVIGYTMVPAGITEAAGPATGLRISGTTLAMIVGMFIIANYAYQGAQPFYNAMLSELAPPEERGRLSGLGTALGFLGSITGVVLGSFFFVGGVAGVFELPAGVVDFLRSAVPFTSEGGRVSTLVPTALMFLLFSLPLFLFVIDHNPVREKKPIRWRESLRDTMQTIRDSKNYPGARRFILSSFLYQDAMGTILAFMALYAVVAMGFERGTETTMFLVMTVPAIFGSYLAGVLVDRIGAKRTLMIVIGSWVVLLTGLMLAPSRTVFWVIGFLVGFIYGGVSTAERPLLLSLVPDVEAGRFFSLMVLSSRAAAIVGPIVWALAVEGLTPVLGKGTAYRAAVGTVALAMLLAFILLRKVPDVRGAPRLTA